MAIRREVRDVTINSSSDESGVVNAGNGILSRIEFPASMVGTAVTIKPIAVSIAQEPNASNAKAEYDEDGNAITITFTANASVRLEPALYAGVQAYTIASNGDETNDVVLKVTHLIPS